MEGTGAGGGDAGTPCRVGHMIENRTGHDINCEWQLDQYPSDCTCGKTRPRAPWFVPFKPTDDLDPTRPPDQTKVCE